MKYILTFLTTAILTQSFGQELNGSINFTTDNHGFNIIWVNAKNTNQPTTGVIETKSDSLGHFKMKFEKGGRYLVSIESPYQPDTTFYVNIKQNEIKRLTINYPPNICPYEKTRLTGICPEGNHTDNVIPIVYGFIIGNDEFQKKVERNEIELGGCSVTDCDPNWLCKIHNRRF